MVRLALLILAAGCGNPLEEAYDRDGDGYDAAELGGPDCDDSRPDVNPGVDERCGNGIDDDCDGVVDDAGIGQVTWYLDEDGDSFPSDTPHSGCVAPEGSYADLADGVDCDDTRDDVHPGATETWYDGIDADCDGASDFDADGDGFDHADHGGVDCDDTRDDVHPDATEVCNNGIDDDCDGTPNDCAYTGDVPVDDAATAFLPDTLSGYFSTSSQSCKGGVAPHFSDLVQFGDLTGDGVPDLVQRSTWSAGGAEGTAISVWAGPLDGNVDASSAADVLLPVTNSFLFSIHGDANGDGAADLLVAIPSRKAVRVFFGPLTGVRGWDHADLTIAQDTPGYHGFARAAAFHPDVNGDGASEIVVADPGKDLLPGVTKGLHLFTSPHPPTADIFDAVAVLPGKYCVLDDGPDADAPVAFMNHHDPDGDGRGVESALGAVRFGSTFGSISVSSWQTSPVTDRMFGSLAYVDGLPVLAALNYRNIETPTQSDVEVTLYDADGSGELATLRVPYFSPGLDDPYRGVGRPAYCDLTLDGTTEMILPVGRWQETAPDGFEVEYAAYEVYTSPFDGVTAPAFRFTVPPGELVATDADAFPDNFGTAHCTTDADGQPLLIVDTPDGPAVIPALGY